MFGLTIKEVYILDRELKDLGIITSDKPSRQKSRFILFAKLFLAMGLAWIFEIIGGLLGIFFLQSFLKFSAFLEKGWFFLSCSPHFPSFPARGFLPPGNESLCLYVLKTASRGGITFPPHGVESLFRPLGLETLFRPWDGNSIKVIPPQGWKSCFTFQTLPKWQSWDLSRGLSVSESAP